MLFNPDFASMQVACSKPNCDGTFLHRHHIKHEHLWIVTKPTLWTPEQFNGLVNRYYEFNEEDISRLCPDHHTEIHSLYMWEIEKDQRRRNYLALKRYSWKQAHQLMNALEKCFNTWITRTTPGVRVDFLGAMREFPATRGEKDD